MSKVFFLVLVSAQFAQLGVTFLAQTDFLSDEWRGVATQLPVVVLFGGMTAFFLKWHSEQIAALFKILNRFADVIGELSQQLAINTGTVNESIRSHELVEDIKDALIKSKETRSD